MKVPRIPRVQPGSAAGSMRQAARTFTPARALAQELSGLQGMGRLAATIGGISKERIVRLQRAEVAAAEAELAVAVTEETTALDAKFASGEDITEADLSTMRSNVETRMAGTLERVPPGWGDTMSAALTKQMAQTTGRFARQSLARKAEEIKANHFEAYNSLLSIGDFDSAQAIADSARDVGYTPAQVQQMQRGVTVSRETAKVYDLIGDDPTAESIEAAREYVGNFSKRANMSPDLARQLSASLGARINAFESDLNQQARAEAVRAKAERAEELAGLEAAVNFGVENADGSRTYVTFADLEVMRADGRLTAEEFVPLGKQAQAREAKAADAAEVSVGLSTALSSGLPVVLTPKQQKLLDDEVFTRMFPEPVSNYTNWQPAQQAALNDMIARNIIPRQVTDLMMAGLSSSSPAVTRSAVELSRQLYTSAPVVWDRMGDDFRDFYDFTRRRMDMGVPLETAVEEQRKLISMSGDVRAEMDRSFAAQMGQRDDFVSALTDRLDDDDLPEDNASLMLAEFIPEAKRAYRVNGGNLEAALDLAYNRVKAVFGPSEVGLDDATMVPYPPERAPSGSEYAPELVQDDLTKSLNMLANGPEQRVQLDTERFMYVPEAMGSDLRKALSDTGVLYDTRTYQIRVVPKDGNEYPLDDYLIDSATGVPLQWAPDYPHMNQTMELEVTRQYEREAAEFDLEERARQRAVTLMGRGKTGWVQAGDVPQPTGGGG